MVKNKILFYLIISSLISVLFVGCSNHNEENNSNKKTNLNGKEEITLRFSWWGGDFRHEATLEVMDLFMEQHPDIKIVGEYGGFEGYLTKLTTQLAGKTAPDIMQIDQPVMGDILSRGDFFVDLNDYDSLLDVSLFDQNFLEDYGYYDDQLLALPTGINANNIILNTEIAEEIGIDLTIPFTWDKLFDDAKKVQEYDPEMFLLNIGKNPIRYHVLLPYMYQLTGNQMIQDDFTLGFSRDELIEAYTLIRRIYEEGVTEPAAQSKPFEDFYETNPKWINHQYVGMLHEASMTGPEFYDFQDTATVHLTPQHDDAKDSGIMVKPSQLLSVNKDSEHVEAAIKFLDFFFNSEEAVLILKDSRGVSATELGRKAAEEEGFMDPLSAQTIEMALEQSGMPINSLSNNSEIIAIQYDAIDKLALSEDTVENIADESLKQYENTLKGLKASSD